MTSSVFFKFKSQKEPSRIEFDGTGISVFEVKRDIISLSGLGDGKNFDLKIYNEDGMEEYDDDTTIIPRSTSIIARRLPAIQQGKGKAARYVTGNMPGNIKNASRKEQIKPKAKTPAAPVVSAITENMTEEERMEAMLRATGDVWSAQKEELANHTTSVRGGPKKNLPVNVPNHEPPQGYICYRCQEKGHWIQLCPTNDDPDFEKKPRVKRTTGIPRSFLKTIDKPPALLANDGTVDDTKAPSGIMINAEGQYVIAEPDKKSWEQFQAKTKTSAAAQKAAAQGDKELQERGLECSMDKRIFIDPMKTPCCGKTYCNTCITDALIESDFTCPACQADDVLIDNLIPDTEVSKKIEEYLEEKNAKKESELSTPNSPAAVAVGSPVTAPVEEETSPTVKSPSPTCVQASPRAKSATPEEECTPPKENDEASAVSNKRPAEEELENPKVPKGPKALQDSQVEAPNMMNMPMMTGFGAMPNMFGNGNDMSHMGMMNNFGMGNPMMGAMGMNMNMGVNPMMNFGGMPNMGMMGMGGMPNMGMGMGMMNGMGGNMMNGMGMNGFNGNVRGQFSNQQKTVFAQPLPSEEDSPYMRKPVNPHRHQGRQRRVRPSDYREL